MLLTEFNERRYKFFILFYMLVTILAFNILYASVWAIFGGVGIGSLEYTHIGEIAIKCIYLIPFLLGLGIFIVKMITLYRKKEKPKAYLLHMLACISGIVLGTIIFWLDIYTVQFIWRAVGINLIRVIRAARWVDFPMP